MRKQLFIYAGGLLAFAATGCGGNKDAKEVVVVTDTVVKTEVIEVATPVDTAAITANYEAQKAKTKPVHKAKPKKQADKEVTIQPYPAIESYEPAPAPAPAPQASTPPAQKVKVVHDVQYVYFAPSEKASFPGGEKAFHEFLAKNLQYPEKALDSYVETTVYATVYLDEEGNVTNVICETKDPGYGFRQETTRVLMMSPRWMPARHEGQRVKSKFTIPVTFTMTK